MDQVNNPPFPQGYTLRDWYADHAPFPVPTWYEVDKSDSPIEITAKKFFSTKEYDLYVEVFVNNRTPRMSDEEATSLSEKTAQFNLANNGFIEWKKQAGRLVEIKWRWHYADMVLAERNKTTQK